MCPVPRLCWALILVVCSMALFGCGKDSGNGGDVPNDGSERVSRVTVAAAADLQYALDEVVEAFEAAHRDVAVRVTYGSSGNFFAQLSNKAPFDIFLSADIEYPRKLVEQGYARRDMQFLYAIGQIVVWVPRESKLDVERLGIQALVDPLVRKIAIANPQHAPYGRAAEAALKHLGVYERVRERLVLGENIAQTAHFVEAGAADIGIIALSLAIAPALQDKGRYWIVPLDAYPTLEQGGVILDWSREPGAAEKLRAFIIGNQGRAILERYGLGLPGE